MIIIDGRQSSMEIGNFANLEEILVKVMEQEVVSDHIVTDVIVNQEAFTEIYPHHAEDVEIDEIQSVEVRTMSVDQMAGEVSQELFTVVKILQNGSKGVANFLRQGDIAEGLEVLQDLLDVTRNFLTTISVLHQRFPQADTALFEETAGSLDKLLIEMCDVMTEQDWLLLADLLEYEFIPACEEWEQIIGGFVKDIAASKVE
ncbi:conserved hypothetical protein [uncultured delta proteobacterium]|uniref:Uncharacterized protein n=1 Tax=uncultured delta proteobacterium TaxID=34034 RepID=A0A212J5N0_9DELT|nr:conserved hypothetical protein [uncultured delta proteobacterium]